MVTARAGVDSRGEVVAAVLVAWARGQQGEEGEVVRFRMHFEDRTAFADRLDGRWDGGGVKGDFPGVELSLGGWRPLGEAGGCG